MPTEAFNQHIQTKIYRRAPLSNVASFPIRRRRRVGRLNTAHCAHKACCSTTATPWHAAHDIGGYWSHVQRRGCCCRHSSSCGNDAFSQTCRSRAW